MGSQLRMGYLLADRYTIVAVVLPIGNGHERDV